MEWNDIDIGQMATDLGFLERFTAMTSGALRVDAPAEHNLDWARLEGSGWVSADRVRGLGIENLSGRSDINLGRGKLGNSVLFAVLSGKVPRCETSQWILMLRTITPVM